MFQMLSKKRNQKGFTLIEMLIVVAIIAILVAIAVPTFSAQLNKAKISTDQSNLRSAMSLALADYMTEHQGTSTVTFGVAKDDKGNLFVYDTTATSTSGCSGYVASPTALTPASTGHPSATSPLVNTGASPTALQIKVVDGKISGTTWGTPDALAATTI